MERFSFVEWSGAGRYIVDDLPVFGRSLSLRGALEMMADALVAGALPVRMDGSHETSRGGPVDLVYRMVPGVEMAALFPWMDWLYRNPIAETVAKVAEGWDLVPDPNMPSGLNGNVLDPGGEYEWHVDGNEWTAVLYLTACDESTGGRLLTRDGEGRVTAHSARWGDLVVLHGREVEHAVERTAITRVSVPCGFVPVGAERPEGLDAYLHPAAV